MASTRAGRRNSRSRLAVALLVLQLLCVLLPVGVIVVWAFADSWTWPNLLPAEWSLRGLSQVLSGRQGTGVAMMAQSIGIAFACALLSTLVASMASRAIACYEWRGRTAFRFALILPFLIPTTVFAMGVQVAFIKMGMARTVPGVILAHAIVALPYSIVILLDVTRAVGTRREEAARSLGATPAQMLVHVTIPALMPGILSSLSMAYIISFSQYFLTLLIGGGKVQTFATVMFPYFSGGDRTIASAYGLAFIVITFVVFLIFELLLRRFGVEENDELFAQ